MFIMATIVMSIGVIANRKNRNTHRKYSHSSSTDKSKVPEHVG